MSGYRNRASPTIAEEVDWRVSVAAGRGDPYYGSGQCGPLNAPYGKTPMKNVVILISLAILAGCGGAGKAAMDTGKSFDRFACMSRNFKGEPPCPQQEGASQPAQ